MNKEEFNNFIRFSDQKDYIENQLYKEEWVTVYQSKKTEKNGYTDDICFYPCLVNMERKKSDYIEFSDWIMSMNSGQPSIVEYSIPLNFIGKVKQKLFSYKTKNIKKYERFSEKGIEPLVHIRDFFNNYPSYIEISEEFRHYFNLYEDKNKSIFLSSDSSGNPIEVIKVFDNEKKVEIKKKYLNEFLFVKKIWLCIQFDHRRWFKEKLEKPVNEKFQSEDKNFTYSLNSENTGEESFTILTGRKFIEYKDVKFLWYEQEKKYEEFSFINENGDEKIFTCEESKLANNFGKNKDAPNYLTPISFRKEVLKKYYDKPSQYSVSDQSLKCGFLWLIQIDIQDDCVMVFLGDLSKLPYEEQKYWRSYNIIEKAKISRVNWERSFQCLPTETDRPDFYFKKRYKQFNTKWNEKYNWFFFKSLSEKDNHCFNSLRIPLDEEQQEFDTQIQNLTKIFIESINIKEIKKAFPEKYKEDSKTIDILEQFLKVKNNKISPIIEFLRKLQKLRSKGSAHIETDKEYIKVLNYFKQLERIKKPDSKIEIFSQILIRCIWIINFLERYFLSDKDSKMRFPLSRE